MITKTVTVQLFAPSRTKKNLLLLTMNRYAMALQYLLDMYHPAVDQLLASGNHPSQFALMKLPDRDALNHLNQFEMQPFKDSLKLDFAMLISSYLSLSATRKTSYPIVYTDDKDIDELLSSQRPAKTKTVTALSKYHAPRTLFFGRYDTGRDFCLLKDELSGRYFAKTYLFPAISEYRRTYTESRRLALKYATENPTYLETRKQRERYLIFPLACGKKQTELLDEAAKNPSRFRTARLYCRGDKFYLAFCLVQETGNELRPESYIGLARGYDCPLHLSLEGLCTAQDTGSGCRAPESYRLTEPSAACDNNARLHIWANQIIRIARDNSSQILYEGLARRTDLLRAPMPAGRHKAASIATSGKIASLTIPEYKQLCALLPYKAAEAGLPKPLAISPLRLYQTCPSCGHCSSSNRFLPGLMICTKCGYSVDSNVVGSRNLIRRFENYQKQRVVFSCLSEGRDVSIENSILGIKCRVRASSHIEEYFCAQLEEYLKTTAPREKPFPYREELGRQKYGLLRKLRAAPVLADSIELVGLPCKMGTAVSQYQSESEP